MTLIATQTGKGDLDAAPPVTSVFRVAKAMQTITPFNPIPPQAYGEQPFRIPLPTATSGRLVKVTVKSGPARISNGLVTPTGAGTVVLNAAQAGNVKYNAAPSVTTSFTVSKPG